MADNARRWSLVVDLGGGQGFFRWLLTKGDVTKVLDPILHYLHEGRKDISTRASSSHKKRGFFLNGSFFGAAQRGLILLGTFALLHLSSKREFGVQLNKPFVRRVTIDLPTFTGNYADYLILVRLSLVSRFTLFLPPLCVRSPHDTHTHHCARRTRRCSTR
jgi:hypothetical protein